MNFGIIAAGEGSRLVQEGVNVPKPLVILNGKPMIERLIDLFCNCGAENINIIVNEEMKEVFSFLEEKKKNVLCPLKITVKSTPSSMHSFYELARELAPKGRYIVTTVDTVFREIDFRGYVKAFVEAGVETQGMMPVTSFIDDEKPLYVKTELGGRITAFLDKKDEDVKYISAGIYGLSQSSLPVLEKALAEGTHRMRNYQRALVASGLDLQAYDIGKVVDVDHAGDIITAEKFLNENL